MDELQTCQQPTQQTGNNLSYVGIRTLSDSLKISTTLQRLDLRSVQEKYVEYGGIADIVNNKHEQAGNDIGDEGARALSDALKTNTTLQSLDLSGEQEGSQKD